MDGLIPTVDPNKCLKTYGKASTNKVDKSPSRTSEASELAVLQLPTLPKTTSERTKLTTKNAVELMLEGKLKSTVCRYCLHVSSQLSQLDQILHVAGKGSLYKVAIKDMVASFHPFKVADDPNFPNKICENCLDRATSCYLFAQQCEQAERALQNCFDDIFEKMNKLDPLERTKKRGRQKLHPNYNIIKAEHEKVIDYADPIIHLVNTASEVLTAQRPISELECLKCCEILPNLDSLINHTAKHPRSMWYNCRLCGVSFAKRHHIKKHFNSKHAHSPKKDKKVTYDCKRCGVVFEKCIDYLRHIEKHKFKTVMEHLSERKMDKLCALCYNKGSDMTELDRTICFHGVCPELTGEKSLKAILASTLSEINLDNYTGTKICEICINSALTSYVFIAQSYFARNRLGKCVTAMLDQLNAITDVDKNVCIEIATDAIVNIQDEETVSENEDDSESKIEVLEDEFRLKSDEESDTDITEDHKKEPLVDKVNKNVLNGYKYANEICGEFLTFKKKPKRKRPKFICPICIKHFVSDYFLKRHISKHIPMKVECNFCNAQFKSKFDLYEHKKHLHISNENKSIYVCCKICGRYIDYMKLKHHERRHKNSYCQLCDKKFISQTTYIQHMRRHINKIAIIMKKFCKSCSFCEKNCSNDNEFSLHVNKVHLQMKPYICDMCDRNFYTEYNLKCHRKVHSAYSKEQCVFCNKILNSRKKLVIHIRRHIGDKPFYCQICNQAFYTQLELKKHSIKQHGGNLCCEVCTLCKSIFVNKKELKCHMDKVHNML